MGTFTQNLLANEIARAELEEFRAQRGLLGQQRNARNLLLARAPEYINAPNQTAMLGQEVFGMGKPRAEAMYGSEPYARQMERGMPFAKERFEGDLQTQALRADPATMLPKFMANMGPRAPLNPTVVGDKQRLVGGDPNNPTVLVDSVPEAAKPFEPKNMQRPGTNDVRLARTQQEFDSLASKGYAQAGNSVPGAPTSSDDDPPQGYRWSKTGTALEIIPGGPADVGQKGLPQKYKDQTSALDQMDGAITEYERLFNEVGTELWDEEKAAQLESLQTQLLFGLKGIEQTGALDRGSVEVMAGIVPKATGLSALNPRGAGQVRARVKELKKYVSRARSSIDSAYNSSNPRSPSQASPQPPGPPPIGKNGKPMKWVP